MGYIRSNVARLPNESFIEDMYSSAYYIVQNYAYHVIALILIVIAVVAIAILLELSYSYCKQWYRSYKYGKQNRYARDKKEKDEDTLTKSDSTSSLASIESNSDYITLKIPVINRTRKGNMIEESITYIFLSAIAETTDESEY